MKTGNAISILGRTVAVGLRRSVLEYGAAKTRHDQVVHPFLPQAVLPDTYDQSFVTSTPTPMGHRSPRVCPRTRWGVSGQRTTPGILTYTALGQKSAVVYRFRASGKNATRFRRFVTRSGGRRGSEVGRFGPEGRLGVSGQPETQEILPQDDLRGVSIRSWGQKTRCKACKPPCKRISEGVMRRETCGRQDVDRIDQVDQVESCGRRTCGRRGWGAGPGRDGRRIGGRYITIVPLAGSRRDRSAKEATYA